MSPILAVDLFPRTRQKSDINLGLSSHLEACVDGRLEMRDRICRLCEDCDSLKQKLKEEYNTSDSSGLIYVLTDAIQVKKEGETRRNLSFATKFCSYAAKFLETGTSFSKYDKVVSEALPLYAEIYLERKYKKNVFKIENEVDKKLKDEEKLKYRLDVYEKYMNVIKEILGKIPEEEISLDEFDHIVWYSLKGK